MNITRESYCFVLIIKISTRPHGKLYIDGLLHHIKCDQDIFVETIYVAKSGPCVVLNQTEQCSLKEQNLCDLQLFNGPNVHQYRLWHCIAGCAIQRCMDQLSINLIDIVLYLRSFRFRLYTSTEKSFFKMIC